MKVGKSHRKSKKRRKSRNRRRYICNDEQSFGRIPVPVLLQSIGRCQKLGVSAHATKSNIILRTTHLFLWLSLSMLPHYCFPTYSMDGVKIAVLSLGSFHRTWNFSPSKLKLYVHYTAFGLQHRSAKSVLILLLNSTGSHFMFNVEQTCLGIPGAMCPAYAELQVVPLLGSTHKTAPSSRITGPSALGYGVRREHAPLLGFSSLWTSFFEMTSRTEA